MLNLDLKLDLITSKTNTSIVKYAKLANKKYRFDTNLYLCEGIKLFEEALNFNANIECVIVENDANLTLNCVKNLEECLKNDVKVLCVSHDVFQKVTTEISPQGIITVCRFDNSKIRFLDNELVNYSNEKVMLFESVRDPGNLGTILRNAVAFGYDRLILSSDCVDIYSPKVIRASMGAIFKLKIDIVSNVMQTIINLKNSGKRILSSVLNNNALVVGQVMLSNNDVIIIGNEGHGISSNLIEISDGTIFIPIESNTESLNASVASTIFMWEQY